MTRRGRRRLLILLVLLALAGVSLAGAWAWRTHQRDLRLAEHRAAGLAAYEQGEHARALPHLGSYVGRVKDDREALLALADSRRRIPEPNGRHMRSAIAIAQAAVALDVDDLEPREMLLEMYRDAGLATELEQTAGAILQRRSGHRGAMLARVQALLASGRPQRALEAAEAFVSEHPDDLEAHEARIGAMLRADRPESEVHASLAQLQQHFADAPEAVLVRADLLARSGRLVEAADALLQAAGTWQGNPRQFIRLVDLMDLIGVQLAARGRRDLAQPLFARTDELIAAHADASASISFHAALRDWMLERPQQALDRVAPALADPASAPLEALGLAALIEATDRELAGAPDAALAQLQQRQPAGPWLALARAARAIDSADHAGAIRLLEQASFDHPDHGAAQAQIASLLHALANRSLDNRAAAERAWTQLATSAAWRRARGMLARSLLARGEPLRAAQAVLVDPDIDNWWGGLELLARATVAAAEVDLPAEDLDNAVRLVQAFDSAVPDNPVVMCWHARLLLVRGEHEQAMEIARRLLDTDLAQAATEAVALVSRIRPHDAELAERILGHVRGGEQLDAESAYHLAIALAVEGRAEEGRALLRERVAAASDATARLDLRRAQARFLDGIGHESAVEELLRLSADYSQNALVQFDVLHSRAAWEHPERLGDVIDRLRNALGEGSDRWRLFDARSRLMVVESETEITSAVLSLSQFLQAEGDSADALSLMSRGYVMLAEAAQRRGDFQQALHNRRRAADYLQRAVDQQAAPAGFPPLVRMLRDLGRTTEARAALERFARIEDVPPALARVRASLLEELAMRDLALIDRRRLADTGEPADVLSLALLGLSMGESQPLRREIELLFERDDLGEQEIILAAQYLGRIGEIDAGRAMLDRLPESVGDQPRDLLVARYLMELRQPGLAAEALARSAAAMEDPEAWGLLVQAQIAAGEQPRAEQTLADAIARFPEHQRLRSLQAAIAADASRPPLLQLAAAIRALSSPDDGPGADRLHEQINRLLAGELATERFLVQMRELTEHAPTLYPAWRLLMQAQIEASNSTDQAIQTAQRAVRTLPSDPRPARDAVGLLLAAGRDEQALAMAREWSQRDPTDANAAIAAGRIELRRARPAQALVWFEPWREQILQQAETQRGALAAYAAALAATGRERQAFEIMDQRLAAGDPWPAAFVEAAASIPPAQAAVRRRWLDRVAAAVGDTADGLDARIDIARAFHTLALQTANREDLDRALAEVARAESVASEPTFRLVATLGELHQAAGDAEATESAYRAALAMEPDHPDLLNNLAYLIYERDGSAEEAVALARRAIESAEALRWAPEKIALYYDTLGVALAAGGRIDAALEAFQAGLRHDSLAPHLLVGAAEAHVALGQPERARESLRSLGPIATLPSDVRPRAAALIQSLQ